jgi:hypothetical protein
MEFFNNSRKWIFTGSIKRISLLFYFILFPFLFFSCFFFFPPFLLFRNNKEGGKNKKGVIRNGKYQKNEKVGKEKVGGSNRARDGEERPEESGRSRNRLGNGGVERNFLKAAVKLF